MKIVFNGIFPLTIVKNSTSGPKIEGISRVIVEELAQKMGFSYTPTLDLRSIMHANGTPGAAFGQVREINWVSGFWLYLQNFFLRQPNLFIGWGKTFFLQTIKRSGTTMSPIRHCFFSDIIANVSSLAKSSFDKIPQKIFTTKKCMFPKKYFILRYFPGVSTLPL